MRINYDNLCIITENLASLYEDGIPIRISFELLLELPLKKEYKESLREISYKLLKGYSLSDGFKEYKDLYPKFFVNIISLGEDSGSLVKCLNSLSNFYKTKNKLKRDIMGKLRYPCFTLGIFFILMTLLFLFVIPNLYESFSSITKDVPKSVEFIYRASKWILDNICIVFIALICWDISLYYIFKLIKDNMNYNSILLRVSFIKKYYEYVFILLISTILNSGIQISEGIYILIKSMEEGYIKNHFMKINDRIMDGEELNESIKEICFISKYTYSMISLGENTGELSNILLKVEKRLSRNMEENLSSMINNITPISIVVMAIVIIASLFIFIVPLLNMMYSGMNI